MMGEEFHKIIEEIKETAKGSDKERLARLEFCVQTLKNRLDRLERKSWGDEA